MADNLKLKAEEAQRLKNDTAFKQFVEDVRNAQKEKFVNSQAHEVELREDAHAIIRALNEIEINLDATIGAERLVELRRKV